MKSMSSDYSSWTLSNILRTGLTLIVCWCISCWFVLKLRSFAGDNRGHFLGWNLSNASKAPAYCGLCVRRNKVIKLHVMFCTFYLAFSQGNVVYKKILFWFDLKAWAFCRAELSPNLHASDCEGCDQQYNFTKWTTCLDIDQMELLLRE